MDFKSIFIAFLVVSFLSSCDKEEPIENIPITSSYFSNLEVAVIECDDIACANITTPSGINISLFLTENDAIESNGLINDGITDSDGKVFFTGLSAYDGVFVKIEYEDQIYISYNSLGIDVTAFHEAIFIVGYSYDSNDQLERNQDHISLSLPLVGQQSIYQYYYKEEYDFAIPAFDTVNVVVTIDQKISDNIFIVSERMSSQPEDRYIDYPEGYIVNYWEFTEDSLIVTPYETPQLGSYIFGFGEYFFPPERFSVALNSPLENEIELDDPTLNLGPFGSNLGVPFQPYYLFTEDVNFNGSNYDLLRIQVVNNMPGDGELKVLMYNDEDGFVRFAAFDFWQRGSYSWVLTKE